MLTPGLPAQLLCALWHWVATSAMETAKSLTHPSPPPPSGLLLKLPFLDAPPDSQCYEDQIYWEVRQSGRPSGPQGPVALPCLTSYDPACLFPSSPPHSPLGCTPELWHPATWSYPFTQSPTPALQVPGEHEDEAQGPLRQEEPDTQA